MGCFFSSFYFSFFFQSFFMKCVFIAFIIGTNICDIYRQAHHQISGHPLIWEKMWPHHLLPPSPFSCPSLGDPQSCPCGISPSSSKADMEPPASQRTQPWCWSTTPRLQVSDPRCQVRATTYQDMCMEGCSDHPASASCGGG